MNSKVFDVEVELGDLLKDDPQKLFLYFDIVFSCVVRKNYEVRHNQQGTLLVIHDVDNHSLKVFEEIAAGFNKTYKFIKKETSC